MFGGLQLRREGALFFSNFYNDQFSGNSDVISVLKFLPVPDLKPQATTLRK